MVNFLALKIIVSLMYYYFNVSDKFKNAENECGNKKNTPFI